MDIQTVFLVKEEQINWNLKSEEAEPISATMQSFKTITKAIYDNKAVDYKKGFEMKNLYYNAINKAKKHTFKPTKANKDSFDLKWNKHNPVMKQDLTSRQLLVMGSNADMMEELAFENLDTLENRLSDHVFGCKAQKFDCKKAGIKDTKVISYLNNQFVGRIKGNKDKISREQATKELFLERARVGAFEPHSLGNAKILNNVVCINMESATHCSSKACGSCKLEEDCYAFKYERSYKNTLIRNECNKWYWSYCSGKDIAGDILSIVAHLTKRYGKIKTVRLSVEGDFTNAEVYNKVTEVSAILECWDIHLYTYTHRINLPLRPIHTNLTINGSIGGMGLSNEFLAVPEALMPENPKYECVCASDNSKRCGVDCNLCYTTKGITIYEKLRI